MQKKTLKLFSLTIALSCCATLAQGAQINYATQKGGIAALLRSAECGNKDGIDRLLASGLRVDDADERGATPLLFALASRHHRSDEIVHHLLSLGANPCVKTTDGYDVMSIINDEEKITIAPTVMQALLKKKKNLPPPADLSFLIADLKLDANGHVTLLELGEGQSSYFKGHDALGDQGAIWRGMWNFLFAQELPVWCVDNTDSNSKENSNRCALAHFKQHGGIIAPTLHLLEKDPRFIAALDQHREHGDHQSPSCIVLLKQHRAEAHTIKQFHLRYPSILIVNDAARPFASSKFMTSLLFHGDSKIEQHYPHCQFYPKKYSPELVEQIKSDFHYDQLLVIKPLAGANGWGVIITTRAALDQDLKRILTEPDKLRGVRDLSYSYWLEDSSQYFMVESFAPSKKIISRGRQFEGTMRQVFLLRSTPAGIELKFIGSYWKLPAHSTQDNVTPTQRLKSRIGADSASSMAVSPQDDRAAQQALKRILPLLYKKMLCAL